MNTKTELKKEREVLEEIKNANIKDIEGEMLSNEKYGDLYDHLLKVFNMSQFDDNMKLILLKMSLVPYIYRKDINEWLDENNFDRINELKNRGWIEYNEETKQYSLHPVISMFFYGKMYEKRWQECDSLVYKAYAFIKDFDEIKDFDRHKEVIDFGDYAIKRIVKESLPCSYFYHSYALIQHNIGSYDKALEYYNKSLKIQKEMTGDNTISVSNICSNMSSALHAMGEYDKSMEYFKKSLEIKKRIVRKESISLAAKYYNIASEYYKKLEYDKALENYNKSLEIETAITGEKTLSVAITYGIMATIYEITGEYDNAIKYYIKLYNIGNEKLNDDKLIDMLEIKIFAMKIVEGIKKEIDKK